MGHRFVIALMFFTVLFSQAAEKDSLITRLDAAIADRSATELLKEERISRLKRSLARTDNTYGRYRLLDSLYNEYLTYNFDSSMVYVGRAETIAEEIGEPDLKTRVKIHKALSLATSGHFSQAVNILLSINSSDLSPDIRAEYYSACEWTFGVWAEYSNDRIYAPEYKKTSIAYLDSLLAIMPHETPEYYYRMAEKYLRTSDYANAEKMYLQAATRTPENTRLYAQIAYALALSYKEMGIESKYREWLIRSAISDQITPLKENLALQQLAIYLQNEEEDTKRANKYLRISLEDAIFYNNRLRMLEIAEKFPSVVIKYQDKIDAQNKHLRISLVSIILLLAVSTGILWQLVRQIKKRKLTIEEKGRMAVELAAMNRRLLAINRSREQYTSLFMDLCGAYIEKLNRFPMVLKLKVKQLGDLNSVAERYVRPSEAEIREMFFNFDTAFLKLYPDFISQFNSLLQPDKQIEPKGKELLNTDLRIYSLIRMGITDSNRIASLLFYSPQTIFNHRTSVRNRAKNRDTFEQDVMNICRV